MHPIDWYNLNAPLNTVTKGVKVIHNYITDDELALMHPHDPNPNDLNHTTYKHKNGVIKVLKENAYKHPLNSIISKFTLLCAMRFKNNYNEGINYIRLELMGEANPYIRVRCDYFKVITKQDRYGSNQTELIAWDKSEINQDCGKGFVNTIPQFDEFIIEPNNKDYKPVIDNCYNQYSKFSHTPHPELVTEADIPVTWDFINHIFSTGTPDKSDVDIGLIYLKCLYEHPKQMLPILCLISKERSTGKTTFNNWLGMIFGNNYVSISPEALTKQFNYNYATKNIITFEEAFVEKQAGIEKLKSLSTAKMIDVSQKFVSEYSIPFYGKFILFSNKVLDFMRIDDDEIRFWVRPIPNIKGKRNVMIEEQLYAEIPKFLRYLEQLPPINFDTGSRMLLTDDRIANSHLQAIKDESRSTLYKELEMLILEFFSNNPQELLYATPVDIKERWFGHDSKISRAYISKVLKHEFGFTPMSMQRYTPFEAGISTKTGCPFVFENPIKNQLL